MSAEIHQLPTDLCADEPEPAPAAPSGSVYLDASLAPFLIGDSEPADVWAALGIEKQRAVVRALVDVKVRRSNRKASRFFNPETIEFSWKTA